MIQKANLEKALEIYKYMEKDFSRNEIPDYKRYLKLTKENIHNVYVYKENEQEYGGIQNEQDRIDRNGRTKNCCFEKRS